MQVFDLVKQILRCKYLIIEFGNDHKWMSSPFMASICSEIRIIMQNQQRLKSKMIELTSNIERQIKAVKTDNQLASSPPDVFISYCWKNSHDAIAKGTKPTDLGLGWLDPRSLVEFFKKNNVYAWIDVESMSDSSSLFGEITKGLNKAKVAVVCISDEYVESLNCSLEFKFAHVSLKLPIVKAVVGRGDQWRRNELAFLAGGYTEVNFQHKNKEALDILLKNVQELLEAGFKRFYNIIKSFLCYNFFVVDNVYRKLELKRASRINVHLVRVSQIRLRIFKTIQLLIR